MFSSSNPKPKNPFHHITAIHDPAMFFGRQRTLERIYALVGDKQNIALIGPRRIGKSSILSCMQFPEFQCRFTSLDFSMYIFIHIDLEEHRQKTIEDFLRFTSKQLLRKVAHTLPFGTSHFDNVNDFSDLLDLFSDLLDYLNDHNFYPVLMLDELDCITSNSAFEPSFFMFLRSQANLGKISYITASLAPLETLSHPDLMGSPFFNIFDFCSIGPLTHDEALQLIAKPAQAEGYSFSDAEIKIVRDLAGCHPFFIQRVCYFLFEEKVRSNNTNANEISIQAYNQLKPHLEYIWAHLTELQQENLKNETRRQIQHLTGLPEMDGSALFRQFIRNKFNPMHVLPKITVKDLKQALKKINDFAFLGESKLSYLNIVQTEIKLNISLYERGKKVHDIIISEIDKLKPKGSSGLDFGPYSILKYCYLDKEWKNVANKQIAAHCFVSERTFYRDRDKAIEDLLNILLESEYSSTKTELADYLPYGRNLAENISFETS